MRRCRFHDLLVLAGLTIASIGYGVFALTHSAPTEGYTIECSIGGAVVSCKDMMQ